MERLGALAGLEQERAAGRRLGERGLQLARLAGEDERRHDGQPARAASARSSLGHSGWWRPVFARHEEGVQTGFVTAIGFQV